MNNTVCHEFRLMKQMIIFQAILADFESSRIFGDSLGTIKNWLEHKTKPPSGNLACPHPWNALYVSTN
jgi:hypothetical protein